LEYGIAGEKNIAFELKNSHMPIYILHDIYLVDGDLSAQIDYLVFTRKICFVIECKNLFGNLEINNKGDFLRTMEFGRIKKKEGIYSPITQNQRHLELMKKIKIDNKGNVITKFMTEKYFGDFNKSVVVLANPKTVLNAKYAKKEVKDKVIRADQLVKYIKGIHEKSKESSSSEEKHLAWAQSYLNLHKTVEKDYTAKYDKYKIAKNTNKLIIEISEPKTSEPKTSVGEDKTEMMVKVATIAEQKSKKEPISKTESTSIAEPVSVAEPVSINEPDILKELKAYRLQKSRKENIKPYFIYNDMQLKDLIEKMPRNSRELQNVAGFGEAKTNKYGKDILQIIARF